MSKHPVLFWACGFTLGVWFWLTKSPIPILCSVIMAFVAIYPIFKNHKSSVALLWSFFFLFFVGLGCLQSRWTEKSFTNLENSVEEDDFILLRGELRRKIQKDDSFQYYLKNCSFESNLFAGHDTILVYSDFELGKLGQEVVLKGSVSKFKETRNFGNFDSHQYYRSIGIPFAVNADSLVEVSGKKDVFLQGLEDFSERMDAVYCKYMKEENAGVLSAMLLGRKAGLDQETKQLYQEAGISHILAISGLHVSLLGMALYRLLRKCKSGRTPAFLLSSVFLLLYLILSGCGISAERAVGMFIVSLMAGQLRRSPDLFSSLGLLLFMLVCQNPFVLQNSGFLLSFLAVLGIGLLQKLWGVEMRIAQSLTVSLSVFLVSGPVLALAYYSIAPYSPFLNLIVLPLMSPLVVCGLLGGLAGLLSPWAFLPKAILTICNLILNFFDFLCRQSRRLPFSQLVVGKPGTVRLCIYYLLFTLGFTFLMLANKKREEDLASRRLIFLSHLTKVIWPLCLVLILCIHFDRTFHIDVLDVGQGDGTLIHTESGDTVFIDGGSTDVTDVGSNRILPFLKASGYGSIDYWVVSHADEDHISGLEEILSSGYRIKNLLLSQVSYEDQNMEEILELAENNHTKICIVGQKDILYLGGNNRLTFLWPVDGDEFEDRNDGCLCALFEKSGDGISMSALLCGDISSEFEEKLMTDSYAAGLLKNGVTLYKCNHHGSNYSSCAELLNAIEPQVTTISCGADNSYGHPGADTLARLEETGTKVYCTMEVGQISMKIKKNHIFLLTNVK